VRAVPTAGSTADALGLAARLARLRELRGPAVPDFPDRVRELVVIASSSRGGSSMLAELLRHSPHLLHLRAEFNPFLRLAGLAFPDSGTGSDALTARDLAGLDPRRRQILAAELALDAGNADPGPLDEDRYVLDAAWRFSVQWPQAEIDLADLLEAARAALRRARAATPESGDFSAAFQLELIGGLRGAGLPVDAAYYDLPAAPRGPGPAAAPRQRLPENLVEEPPFVLTRPWRIAQAHEAESKPLVVKTPSNAYRLGFLRALFPNARLRVVHLTRNPAAAVNGLYDGWNHHGFHSHRMSEPLGITPRPDADAEQRLWWKFDLPPGWRQVAASPLLDVCAFQWRSAHQAILDACDPRDPDYLRVRFEDLVDGRSRRLATLSLLSSWLGIPFDGALRRAAVWGIAPVAATMPPAPRRWCHRAAELASAITPEVFDVASALGYASQDGWV
jgi:Sulfotransferase family